MDQGGVVKVGGSSAPGSESVQAAAILQRNFGISARTIVVIYHAPTLTAGDAGFRRLVQAGSRRLAVVRGVRSIRDFPGSGDRSLVSGDGHWLLPGHMIVATWPCSCGRGRHTTWECECGDVTYSPKLRDSCELSKGC